jgi:hypothetical protein
VCTGSCCGWADMVVGNVVGVGMGCSMDVDCIVGVGMGCCMGVDNK